MSTLRGDDLRINIRAAEFMHIPKRRDFTFSNNKVSINALLSVDNILKNFDLLKGWYQIEIYNEDKLIFSKDLEFTKFTVHAKLNDVVNGYFLFTDPLI